MRTRQEIIDYLGLWMGDSEVGKESIADNEKYIKAAEKIEEDFATEISEGIYGYGLHCDFVNTPDILEDYGDHPVLTEVANYDGVIVYKKSK